jgi:hypothetical protein
MPRGGYAKAAPRHLTLRLDRVRWPSPPDSYKYRGECRSREKRKKRKPKGGKNFGEREKGSDREGRRLGGSVKKKRKKRENSELFGEKQGDRNREKRKSNHSRLPRHQHHLEHKHSSTAHSIVSLPQLIIFLPPVAAPLKKR